MTVFLTFLHKELLLAFRHRHEMAIPLIFFALIVTLFPLAMGPEVTLLRRIAPAVVWIAALLAALLSMHRIFQDDYTDGTLDHLLLAPTSLLHIVLAKITAHWMVAGLPIIMLTPLLALFLGIPFNVLGMMILTLFIGTPVISMVGSIGAALTLNRHQGNEGLLPLLVIPIYIPVLIFSTLAVEQTRSGLSASAHISLLSAILVISLIISPLAASAALKISIEQ